MGIYEIKLLLPNNIWDVSFKKSSQSTYAYLRLALRQEEELGFGGALNFSY